MPSNKTYQAWRRSQEGRKQAQRALDEGKALRISNRTSYELGTVHHGLAQWLVRLGFANYDNSGSSPHIVKREKK